MRNNLGKPQRSAANNGLHSPKYLVTISDSSLVDSIVLAIVPFAFAAAQSTANAERNHLSERDQPSDSADEHTKVEILLAEDNLVSQLVASEMLATWGCQVETVADGQQAVQAMQYKHYDLVLMDCQMPSLDGYEATQQIRQWEATQESPLHTPIIALTANAMTEDRDKCFAVGMDDYLAKPYSYKELTDIVKKWLGFST